MPVRLRATSRGTIKEILLKRKDQFCFKKMYIVDVIPNFVICYTKLTPFSPGRGGGGSSSGTIISTIIRLSQGRMSEIKTYIINSNPTFES